MIIETERARLRPWREDDREAFAALNADPEVMADLGGPLGREASDAKLARYMRAFAEHGFGRWAMEDRSGAFLGYVGMLRVATGHPLAPGVEIGWRFRREVWGWGFASEGARAALAHGFDDLRFDEILAFTAPDNLRSQAVMSRLGLVRDPRRDFVDAEGWRGWVWSAGGDGQPWDSHSGR